MHILIMVIILQFYFIFNTDISKSYYGKLSNESIKYLNYMNYINYNKYNNHINNIKILK